MHYQARHAQRGAALLVGVILTMVTAMVALSSMRGSQFQEGMTANLNHKAIAFTAAEAGASEFFKWLSTEQANNSIDWENPDWQNKWQKSNSGPIQTSASGDNKAGDKGFFWIAPTDVTWNPDFVKVVITGQSGPSADNALGRAQIAIQLQRPTSGGPHPAFMTGLLANKDIDIKGNANLQGSAHANGNFGVTGGNSSLNDRTKIDEEGNTVTLASKVSAKETASMSKVNQDKVISNANLVDVPSAKEYIEANENIPGVIKSCSIPSGNLKGAVYFCSGNLTTKGNFSNATILAKGSVTHGGSSQLGQSQELTVMIVAQGAITINGSNDTYGVFWSDGDVTQNGSSVLGGAVIAGGNITRNGVFNYAQYDDFGDLSLPTAPASGLAITHWAEALPSP